MSAADVERSGSAATLPNNESMTHVSRPLIGLLVGTVAFFALWLVALKPSSSSNGGSKPLGQYQPAVDQARKAVATANAASLVHGGSIPGLSSSTGTTATPTPAAPATPSQAVTNPSSRKPSSASSSAKSTTASQRRTVVDQALKDHKVLALLFFNPAGADDRAVDQELNAVQPSGRLVKLAVPLQELASYSVVTNQVPVDISPTLVLINPRQQASEIVGFADRFEISHRVSDALTVK
jgi:hypothetical protein